MMERTGERVKRADGMTGRVGRRRKGGPPALAEWLEEASPELRWDFPHLVLIREALERVTAGETRRLMLFVRRGMGSPSW
jgi:hypothetical protein